METMNTNPLIEVKNLKKYFIKKGQDLHAVDDINIVIPRGKTLGVVGESGCGKSTLGRTLIRLIEPTSGQILFDGTDITKLNRRELSKYRSKMQIVFQDPYSSLNPRKSVFEIIATPLKVNHICHDKNELEHRVYELMDTVGLARRLANSYPHELDGGRRQRICIARALAIDPQFIVCDEPVSALDVSIQAQILNLLMDLQDEKGLTYMFITHDLSVVRHISDEIMVMYMGQCVEKAETHELFNNPKHPYTKALLSAIPIPDISMRSKRIVPIRGEVTSPVNPAPGCRFAPRCDFCTGECTGQDIPLKEYETGHFVACRHLVDMQSQAEQTK